MKHVYLLMLVAVSNFAVPIANANTVTLATWNMEHLADDNDQGCQPRDDNDYHALKQYASKVNADIFALQEVESEVALGRVFPSSDYALVVTSRKSSSYPCRKGVNLSTAQRVGFAIKKQLLKEVTVSIEEVEQIGLSGNLRYGLALSFEGFNTSILNVHLKSGCFNQSLDSSKACRSLAKQIPQLASWTSNQAFEKKNFMIVGDFNRQLNSDPKFKSLISPLAPLKNAMEGLDSCHPKYKAPIDHVLYSANLDVSPARVYDFGDEDGQAKYADMLSDHCPIKVTVRL